MKKMEYFEKFFIDSYRIAIWKFADNHIRISIRSNYGTYIGRIGGKFGKGEFHKMSDIVYYHSAEFFPVRIQSLFSQIILAIQEI